MEMNFFRTFYKDLKRLYKTGALVLAVSLYLCLLIFGCFAIPRIQARELADIKAEYLSLRTNYEAFGLTAEELRAELLQAAAYLGILNSLQASEPGYWHGLLAALCAAVPNGVQITQLALDDAGLQLRGTASDDGKTALFWTLLEGCGFFCTVRFERIQYGESIAFEMRITLQRPYEKEVVHEIQMEGP